VGPAFAGSILKKGNHARKYIQELGSTRNNFRNDKVLDFLVFFTKV